MRSWRGWGASRLAARYEATALTTILNEWL
jgi:hypothetical protein